jgi:BirA family biotin operon repressor/biotin-[acetyl-CoA-carboxylase] ligase
VPERLATVDSTNRYLVDLALAGLPDGSEVPNGYGVVADAQSAGRGRLDRRWESPPGASVLCSILLRPDLVLERLHLAAWAVALAASRACSGTAGVELWLKWPNDLVTRAVDAAADPDAAVGCSDTERKVAGILSEILPPRVEARRDLSVQGVPAGIVVGIGINVNWPANWPPAESTDPELVSIAAHATSLNRIAGHQVDRNELTARLLEETRLFTSMLASREGCHVLASKYRLACATIGREVRVELAEETVAGLALDLDDAGRLLVSTGACIRTISAGDVVHLR